MLADLLRPFAFLNIKHPTNICVWVCWVLPSLVACAIVTVVSIAGLNVDVFGTNGFVSRFLGFVQNLPGFYIAALAAIATFNNRDMLKLMPGNAPTMEVFHNGVKQNVPLTRRRFLTSMFAYLTALCIALTMGAVAALVIADPIKQALPTTIHGLAKLLFAFAYLALAVQMVCVTFWGLFYLGERMHTPD